MTAEQHVVIVGGSLAGFSCADELRVAGHRGPITVVGDEPHRPYDRAPLSKDAAGGWIDAHRLRLAARSPLDGVTWRLGVPAVALHRGVHQVELGDGSLIDYDRVVLATGMRARSWPHPGQAALEGVFTVRTLDDGAALAAALRSRPRRTVVIGGGFIAGEVASVCRGLGLAVTIVAPEDALLVSSVGAVVGEAITSRSRSVDTDLRLGRRVAAITESGGVATGALLDDGSRISAEVVVVAIGAVRAVGWLAATGLDVSPGGIRCDHRLQALDVNGEPDIDVFAAGDVARWPHPCFPDRTHAVEHWGVARDQGQFVARQILTPPSQRTTFAAMPRFWSNQWGANIKSIGFPALADEIQIMLGSLDSGTFTALYGSQGRTVGAIAVDMPRELEFAAGLVTRQAAFPFPGAVIDARATNRAACPARFAARPSW
jgi:NADPH-dependent 2,4-dienoyl-CoA reductase/sulfur reductase-like enzyme